MTATAADRNLEEQIAQLLHGDPAPEVRSVLEEASQALSGGRHLEAEALIEKAEALVATAAEAAPAGKDVPPSQQAAAAVEPPLDLEPLVEEMAAGVASAVSKALVKAIQNLQHHVTGETRQLAGAVRPQLEKLQTTVESLLPLKDHVGQMDADLLLQKEMGAATRSRCDELSAALPPLQEASQACRNDVTALRGETQELQNSVSDRLNAFSERLDQHRGDLSALRNTLTEINPQVASFMERMDRQAVAIRSLYEAEQNRETAVEQLATALTRLRELRVPPHPDQI